MIRLAPHAFSICLVIIKEVLYTLDTNYPIVFCVRITVSFSVCVCVYTMPFYKKSKKY